MLKQKDKVKVTKLGTAHNPIFRTADEGEWTPGGLNDGMSPPVRYINEGIIFNPPEEGKCFQMFRTKRGNVKADGIFRTSVIQKIEEQSYGYNLYTENSIYKIEVIDERTD